jgi:hypothetical protein
MTWVMDAGTKLTQLGVDIIWIGDDFGTQDRLMISPDLFREFFKPRYEKLFTRLREINPNIKFAFHSDGYIHPIVKDFIEIGLEILNPVQPKFMDPAQLKKEFGRHLTFWGTVDNQFIMPLGTVEDVINEVKLRLRTLGLGEFSDRQRPCHPGRRHGHDRRHCDLRRRRGERVGRTERVKTAVAAVLI